MMIFCGKNDPSTITEGKSKEFRMPRFINQIKVKKSTYSEHSVLKQIMAVSSHDVQSSVFHNHPDS